MNRPALALPLVSLALALAAAGPSHALFKVVGPDGRVTYTDRPPAADAGRVVPVGRAETAAAAAETAALPLALRTAVGRFPVTLYTVDECAACDRGRDLLAARGVPFTERRADAALDRDAWLRIVGGLEAPALAVGSQMLRGFASDTWTSYLDAAGYPRESALPRNWRAAPAQPLVQRSTLTRNGPTADDDTPAPAPAPAPTAAPVPPAAPAGPAGGTTIRF